MNFKNMKSFLKGLMIAVTCLCVFSACNLGGETPEQSISKALNAVKILDETGMQNYFTYDELMNFGTSNKDKTIKDKQNAKLFFSNLDYKIISSSVNGDAATVKTEITNLDMKSIMGEYVSEAMKFVMANAFTTDDKKLKEEEVDKKVEQMLTDFISRKDNKKVTSTVDIKLTKKDKNWKIQMEKGLQDAITGGLVSFSEEITGGLVSFSDEMNKNNKTIDSPKNKLNEIHGYIVSDLWNKGLCDIKWYVNSGTGSTGNSIDIDFTISQLDNAYKKKKAYDEYVQGLDATQFSNVKSIWVKLSPEIDILYNQVKSKKPTPKDSGYNLDFGKFVQYMEAFGDAVIKINEEVLNVYN